ncbi:gastric inhibitory polypeptide [Zonotrichia albicollis]|uniref:gastric inhibitory polypeptide n=1 Tax=Zonotrichia albicollis TaxID=44394 RepID=UPI003D80B335
MSLRALRALPLLLLAGLGAACAEESAGAGPSVPAVRLSRRYSEATLASDYSRTMDHVLRKNFVEWLLARREKKSHDGAELLRREAETPKGAGDGENSDFGTPGAKTFLGWLWKNRDRQSFPALEGSEDLREFWEQEFLTWLLSGELCRPTAA